MDKAYRTGLRCAECKQIKDSMLRMPVELVDKKSKEIIEITYCDVVCTDCFYKRYKSRTKIRVYI